MCKGKSGEDNPRAKLSDNDVVNIRALHRSGLSYGEIARKWEVPRGTVASICKYRRRA